MITQPDAKAKAIMLFSQISNINFDYSTSITNLQQNSNRIKSIICTDNVASRKIKELSGSNWEVVWGPVLNYSPDAKGTGFHADNSLYVAKAKDKNVYVVAVAGTNRLSDFELVYEDIAVKTVKPWITDNSTQGHISNGSMTGLEIVLGKFDYGDKGITLMDFFKAKVEKDGQQEKMEIITCGHSLGGALSPLVALRIKEKYNNIHVSTYPTAGPTSGDEAFASYAKAAFLEGCPLNCHSNYHSVINTNDMVPMAWEKDTLKKIPNIYNKPESGNVVMNDTMKALLATTALEIDIKRIKYTRIAKEQEYRFTGDLIQPKCSEKETKCDLFMVEAMYQHTDTYMTEFFKDENEFINKFTKLVYEDFR